MLAAEAGAAGGRMMVVPVPELPVAPVLPVLPVAPVLPVGPAGPGTGTGTVGVTTTGVRSQAAKENTAAKASVGKIRFMVSPLKIK